jgi:hypothetical protein
MISCKIISKFNRNFEHKNKNLLQALSLLAPCWFGSLATAGLVFGRSGLGRHFLLLLLLIGVRVVVAVRVLTGVC